jgi:dUTP diphosphatase
MIDTGAGVIDADYRGVVFVLLFNHSDVDFQGVFLRPRPLLGLNDIFVLVSEGDRVAQLIIEKIETPEVLEVNVCSRIIHTAILAQYRLCQDLEATLRGAGGFGSTGGHGGL